jgi:hypothetical protein
MGAGLGAQHVQHCLLRAAQVLHTALAPHYSLQSWLPWLCRCVNLGAIAVSLNFKFEHRVQWYCQLWAHGGIHALPLK